MLDLPFFPKQCRQRHSQCSSPRKQNRKYLCQSHLCRPDHSSRRKGDPWPNMFKLVFSLNCREFERHYCITADSLNRANIPPKRICDPVDLVSGRFANESFRQRLVRQRLRSIRQRSKSPCQRPTGQFANVRYLVLTEKKLLIDVCFGEN